MGPFWRCLVLVAGVVLVSTGCTALRQQASISPESSPSSLTSPTSEASPSPSASPSAAKLTVSAAPFHTGEVGVSYSAVTLGATGGIPPYSWSIGGGTFPPGLALSPAGSATGTAGTPGKFSFVVKVADSIGATATKSAGVTVYSALSVTQSCATRCVIGAGCTRCGVFGAVSHGLAPYRYSISGGAVPRGMTLSGLSLKGGFPAGAYGLSIQVSDQLGAQAIVAANWSIYAAAKLTGGNVCDVYGNPPSCSPTGWSYSGGNPTTAPKVVILGYKTYCDVNGYCYPVPTAPPPVWSATAKNGILTITAGGVPCNTPDYGGYLTLALVDTTKCATASRSNAVDLLVHLQNNC